MTNQIHDEEFRRHPPQPLAPRPLNLPNPAEEVLSSGLTIVVVEDHRLPLVSVRLAINAGSVDDPPERPGLSSIMTGLLTEGTTTRQSRQIAEEVARIGASLSAGANSDFLTVAASALSQFTGEIFELLADVTLNPSFPEDELALARENTKQALIQQRAQPSFLSSERIAHVLFDGHPYSVISPTPDSIDVTTREELAKFHNQSFGPNRAVIFAVGDVYLDQIRETIERLFGNWAVVPSPVRKFPAPTPIKQRKAYIVDRPGSEQSNIVIANRSIERTDPDFFPMLLMHNVLGANASSRLFMNLREEKGYTYGAYSTLDARTFGGTFRASAEVRTSVTGPSLHEFFSELDRIRNEDVSEKELSDAKAYLTGVFPIRLETQEGIIEQLVQMKMMGLPNDYLHTYRDKVEAVTIEEVRRAAAAHVVPEKAALVVVGDAGAITAEVGKYASEIEIYDASGIRKPTQIPGAEIVTPPDGLSGTWELVLKLPFAQKAQAKLVISPLDTGLEGHVSSKFGDVELKNIVVNGDDLTAEISLTLMGSDRTGTVEVERKSDNLNGSIVLKGLPRIAVEGHRI